MTTATFRKRHRDLVWSNSRAGDDVLLRAALHKPRFHTLLDACVAFGLPQVRAEWRVLEREASARVRRARPAVVRMLRNISRGFHDAQAGH